MLRSVTMEKAKTLKFPKISAKLCLNGRLWAQFCRCVFGNFPEFRKKTISRGNLGQHLLEKLSSRSWIRLDVISCSPHTSFDEVNDSVMNSERSEIVRGSDPPLVYSAHSMANDLWRAPIRLLLKHIGRLVCRKPRQKNPILSQRAKNRILRPCDGRPQDNTTNLSRPTAWIEINSLAL